MRELVSAGIPESIVGHSIIKSRSSCKSEHFARVTFGHCACTYRISGNFQCDIRGLISGSICFNLIQEKKMAQLKKLQEHSMKKHNEIPPSDSKTRFLMKRQVEV